MTGNFNFMTAQDYLEKIVTKRPDKNAEESVTKKWQNERFYPLKITSELLRLPNLPRLVDLPKVNG